MTLWSLLTSSVLFVLLNLPVAQGQTCSMVTQTDKKISDQFLNALQVISGQTDFSSCSTACLSEADCAVVEYRNNVCIFVNDETALTDQAGFMSAIKVCTNAGTTSTVAYDSTTDSANATRPLLVAVVMTTVWAMIWKRRE